MSHKGKRAGATKKVPLECCRAWADIAAEQRARWEWQVIHQFAHSRTTFSAGTLADRARVSSDVANELISSAQDKKWIWTPSEGVWVGQLTARR